MESYEFSFFRLKFLITVLYLVEMLIFGDKRIANTTKHFSSQALSWNKIVDGLQLQEFTIPILVLLFLLLPGNFF